MENTTTSLMKKLSRYESEISSILGMLVVAALAVFIFLFVKRFMPKPSITPIAETTQSTAEDLMKANSAKKTYTVQAGQGLAQVAQDVFKDKSLWKKIAEANGLKAPYTLEKGQVLTLPEAKTTITEVAPAKVQAAPAAKAVKPTVVKPAKETTVVATTPKEGTYAVVKGDHLWKIAQKQYGSGYAWVKIYKANKKLIGKNPGRIFVGTILTLPEK